MSVEIEKVTILGRDSIHVGYNLIPHIVHTCLSQLPSSTYVLITDTNIAPLYLPDFTKCILESLNDIKKYPKVPGEARFLSKVINPGETSKSRDTKADLEDWMLSHRCTRDTVILALGGGVIGDMIGFVAATFMRGVKFVQIPTTLLAMVDSAIGGKTAVDTPLGKNLIGSFHQPEYIFEDLSFLNTLPNREFINGMAEVIKTAAIWNEEKFMLLENSAMQILDILTRPVSHSRFDDIRDVLKDVVISSILVKAEVVSADEKEGGLRNLLNFGHSIGHAYEAILTPEVLHGEAVSVGMVKEAELARYLGHLSPNAVGRLIKCLDAWGLPTSVDDKFITSKTGGRKTPVSRLLDIMTVDKKNSGKTKKVVLLKAIGQCYEMKASSVQDDAIRLILAPNVSVHNFSLSSAEALPKITCKPPGSKSISNRALVLAALSGGSTRLRNLLSSDDTRYMQTALEVLGAAIFEREDDGTLLVHGTGKLNHPGPSNSVYLGNAGTAARFLTSVVALASGDQPIVVTGNERMQVRPIGPLVDALRSNGTNIEYLNREGSLPLSINPGFRGGRIELSAKVSSQYVSSLLMVAPFAEEEVHLFLTGDKVISELYIDMTTTMMGSFGIKVQKVSSTEYIIPRGRYTAPSEYEIESDASSATYPLALAALLGLEVHVPNIGTESLQGDARFAKEVLRPMGCSVEQTSTTTTVQGPPRGSLKAIDSIDMETMTDAFLTATVLAAATSSSMSITGIANQRVKECNRIAAMVHGLHQFGIEAVELPDGLTIHGKGIAAIKTPSHQYASDGIHSQDDHRVAMSFSLLGAIAPGKTLILDKACTSKTWPNWWDVLSVQFRVQLSGIDHLPERPKHSVDGESSILVVGMRGAGKTTMGALAAKVLDRPFVDLDDMLEADYKRKIPEITETDGWPSFRAMELATLRKFVSTKPKGWVAACGGGIVETPEALQVLREYALGGGIVLQIHRNITEIVHFLEADKSRPAWNKAAGSSAEEIIKVWERRRPLFDQVANFQYHIGSSDKERQSVRAFTAFLSHIQGREDKHQALIRKPRSYFLSLTYPDVRKAAAKMDVLCAGCDALELRVDLLQEDTEDKPSVQYVAEQVAALRAMSSLPIIFTVRTRSQGGRFPDNDEAAAIELMQLAAKWAVEYIDFEMTWSETALRVVRQASTRSKIIASHHDVAGELSFASATWVEHYNKGCQVGDLVKLIGKAGCMEDNYALLAFRKKLVNDNGPPLIMINMGEQGTFSRILSTCLTPITHELMPFKAAPGQLSLRQINIGLELLGQLRSKQFFIFGSPISHSRSPALHNAGFKLFGLPHVYNRHEAQEVSTYQATIQSPEFGGASVTIPHKQAIIPLLSEVSEEAETIGAVNTLIPINGKIRGDNTDWLGIRNALLNASTKCVDGAGMVLGAGGTARAAVFALQAMKVSKIYICNRTRKNLEPIVQAFPGITPVTSVEEAQSIASLSVAVSTVPADGDLDPTFSAIASAAFEKHTADATLLEMAYKPAHTAMMGLAEAHDWRTVEGLEALVEQGIEQFRLWTGFEMPVTVARDAVLGNTKAHEVPASQQVAGNWTK